jgi:hypothetical protein
MMITDKRFFQSTFPNYRSSVNISSTTYPPDAYTENENDQFGGHSNEMYSFTADKYPCLGFVN